MAKRRVSALGSMLRREPPEQPCISLPRHETALFGGERCVWTELEGIGAPGGGQPIKPKSGVRSVNACPPCGAAARWRQVPSPHRGIPRSSSARPAESPRFAPRRFHAPHCIRDRRQGASKESGHQAFLNSDTVSFTTLHGGALASARSCFHRAGGTCALWLVREFRGT
jgi:hypothetical protein